MYEQNNNGRRTKPWGRTDPLHFEHSNMGAIGEAIVNLWNDTYLWEKG